MKQTETEQILDYLKHIYESINGPLPVDRSSGKEPPLSGRVDALDKKVDTLDKKVGGLSKKVGGLSKSVGKLDDRVSEVQLGLATLAVNQKAGFDNVDARFSTLETRLGTVETRLGTVDARLGTVDARFNKIDKRFDQVDRSIESARVQIVDLVTRVHDELTGRIIDLEVPAPGGKGGGGRGPGGGGVPLASERITSLAMRRSSLSLNGLASHRQPLSARNRSASVPITSPVTNMMRPAISWCCSRNAANSWIPSIRGIFRSLMITS